VKNGSGKLHSRGHQLSSGAFPVSARRCLRSSGRQRHAQRHRVSLQQRGMPLAVAQQLGVGYAASGRGPHPARDWRGGRVVVPHTTLEGRLVNLYGRAVRWTVPAELSRVRWIC